jgi:hypothetical protein
LSPECYPLWDNDLSLIQNIDKDKQGYSIILRHKAISAWFKKACFVVTVLADLAIISTMDLPETVEARGCRLVTAESAEAKHFEPVRMAITRQQLGRTFSDTFGTSASFKAAVIKKEP